MTESVFCPKGCDKSPVHILLWNHIIPIQFGKIKGFSLLVRKKTKPPTSRFAGLFCHAQYFRESPLFGAFFISVAQPLCKTTPWFRFFREFRTEDRFRLKRDETARPDTIGQACCKTFYQHLSASQFLQHFLFTPEQQHNYVYKLSGGEKRKLYLCISSYERT